MNKHRKREQARMARRMYGNSPSHSIENLLRSLGSVDGLLDMFTSGRNLTIVALPAPQLTEEQKLNIANEKPLVIEWADNDDDAPRYSPYFSN